MVIRHRKRDRKPFLGCSNFPDCRQTEAIETTPKEIASTLLRIEEGSQASEKTITTDRIHIQNSPTETSKSIEFASPEENKTNSYTFWTPSTLTTIAIIIGFIKFITYTAK